jgi:hypothetical protein
MPPTPSVMEWWILVIKALRSPSRPSTTTNSHNGRARSKPCMATGSAMSNTWRRQPGASGWPMRMKRRW